MECGISEDSGKYMPELSRGRTLIYEGEKYHSYANGNKIAWSDSKYARAGTSLELILTSMYIKSKQENSGNKPSKIKEFLAA